MNVKSREFAPFTFKRDLKNNKLAEGLGGFLWWLLAPVLWPKRSRREGTKKKLKKIRQIIRLLEAYPDKPQWKLIATFGPTPKNQNDNYRPHSMIDALRIATKEETRLLDEGKKKSFLSPVCTFSAPGNIELTRSLYVSVFRRKGPRLFKTFPPGVFPLTWTRSVCPNLGWMSNQ